MDRYQALGTIFREDNSQILLRSTEEVRLQIKDGNITTPCPAMTLTAAKMQTHNMSVPEEMRRLKELADYGVPGIIETQFRPLAGLPGKYDVHW